ncbi:hypothetical protein Pla108_20040 [Botrimarina colliarenosi]|uniref:PEP-CTERM protein-sorting domain-containing protein n=1 Tax=Botrimarina colliarenosi TaxID=2528001 RepID=A0A5C6AFK7_9BACT|nr:hypothetical protein [Botrimarina colliarenosi]TWT97851.1 hypothetical protein Pla108_20040 [Botrimarina colliarenosi]
MTRSPSPTRVLFVLAVLCLPLVAPTGALALTVGQIDAFTTGNDGWMNNGGTATHQATDGADGPADGYVEMTTTGNGQGSGSRLVVNGSDDWLGNYLSTGVTQIAMDANNFSAGDVYLRLAFRSAGDNTVFVTNEVVLAPASDWTGVVFDLSESNMAVSGVSYADTFSAVQQLRVIHRYDPSVANGGPPDAGDAVLGDLGSPIVARVGIDNVRALGVPEPSTAALVLLACCSCSRPGRSRPRF